MREGLYETGMEDRWFFHPCQPWISENKKIVAMATTR